MDDAIFKLPTPLMLSKVVDAMDDLYTQMAKLNDSDAEETYTSTYFRSLQLQE